MYGNRVSTSSAASSRKQHNDRNQLILKLLLKEPANKNCADCKTATHPRWASWNLGCFICIRCSGIHRSMGTHISRVKSVDLDSWTDEQIKTIVSWGNAKLNHYWESGLPENYVPDDSKIENFIRTKYEKRKWTASKNVPDPSTIQIGNSTSSGLQQLQQQPQPQQLLSQYQDHKSKPVPALPKKENQPSLLDLDFGSSTSTVNSVSGSGLKLQLDSQPLAGTQSLPNLQNSLLSTGSQQTRPPPQTQQPSTNARPDLKKSILSLYSTPASSTPSFGIQQSHAPVSQPFQSIVNSVPSAAPVQFSTQQLPQQPLFGANPWAKTAGSSNSTTKNLLDDDLFKNVWS